MHSYARELDYRKGHRSSPEKDVLVRQKIRLSSLLIAEGAWERLCGVEESSVMITLTTGGVEDERQ